MKKIILLTASVFVLSFSPANTHDASAASQHEMAHQEQGKLYVSATGTVAQIPDQASVSAGVVTQAVTAGDAMRQNARQMSAAFAALKAAGIKERDIQTSQMSLQPRYDYKDRKAPIIVGYEVRNTVSARTEYLENVGPMLDALVTAGVNTINGVTFSIKNSKSAKNKARLDAIAEARAKASGMANAAGVRLGKVLEIRENTNNFNPRPQMMMARVAMDEASTPISAGEQTLTVTVNITYALDQ